MRVAWISYFPTDWLPGAPEEVRNLPRQHPASWQRVLLNEFENCPKLDLHIISVRRHYPRSITFRQHNATFHCLKLPRGMRTLTLFWWETLLIARRLKAISPDLVHAWGVERGAALVASRLPYRYLVTIQGLLKWYLEQARQNYAQVFEASLEAPAMKRASVVTTESTFSAAWLKREYPHLQIVQAEHAPDWTFHRIERRPVLKPLRFLYVGAIALIKGTDILVRALDQLRSEIDFTLTIVGGGAPDFLARLKQDTSQELWERITLRKALTPAQVAEEMQSATLMLFPTRADTSPNSVKEAVVAGLPVVASAVGGIPDYVKSGRNGVTCAPKDLAGFVRAVRTAVAHPRFGVGKVDEHLLTEMRTYLSPASMSARFLETYRLVFEPPERSQAKT